MARASLDITGKIFGSLTVIGLSDKRTDNGRVLWDCLCSCGRKHTVRAFGLTSGSTNSCGCQRKKLLRQAHWQGAGELGLSYWSSIVRHAKERKIRVSISIQDAWKQYESQSGTCPLSGERLYFSNTSNSYDGTASLDRIDSSKGYVSGNIQWVHKTVNNMKQALPEKEFVAWCKKISDRH